MWRNSRRSATRPRIIPQLEVLESRRLPSSTPLFDNLTFDVAQFKNDISSLRFSAAAKDFSAIKSDLRSSSDIQREIVGLPPAQRMSADAQLIAQGQTIAGIGIIERDFSVIGQGINLMIAAAGDELRALPLVVLELASGLIASPSSAAESGITLNSFDVSPSHPAEFEGVTVTANISNAPVNTPLTVSDRVSGVSYTENISGSGGFTFEFPGQASGVTDKYTLSAPGLGVQTTSVTFG